MTKLYYLSVNSENRRSGDYEYIVEEATLYNSFGFKDSDCEFTTYIVHANTDINGKWSKPYIDITDRKSVILVRRSLINDKRSVTNKEPTPKGKSLPKGYWYA